MRAVDLSAPWRLLFAHLCLLDAEHTSNGSPIFVQQRLLSPCCVPGPDLDADERGSSPCSRAADMPVEETSWGSREFSACQMGLSIVAQPLAGVINV